MLLQECVASVYFLSQDLEGDLEFTVALSRKIRLIVGEREQIDFEVGELCESFDVVNHEFFQVIGIVNLEHPNFWTDDKIVISFFYSYLLSFILLMGYINIDFLYIFLNLCLGFVINYR